MTHIKWLALLPFIGILVGVIFANRFGPMLLGMPFILAWLAFWLPITSAVMAVIYFTDPANRREGGAG